MPSAAGNAGKGALEGAGVGAKIGSIVPGIGNLIGGAIGGVVGGIAGLAGTQYSGASAQNLALAIARAEAGLPPVSLHSALGSGNPAQQARIFAEQNAILAPRVAQIMADPTFRATKNVTFQQAQSVPPRPQTQALYAQGVQQYNAKQGGSSGTGPIAPGLSASMAGGGGNTPLPGVPPLQTGNLPSSATTPISSDTVGDVGSAVGGALSNVPGVGESDMSIGDELLGAAGAINSGIASQKQGSLLNNALNTYNQNYNQGKAIITAPHPVDLSAAFYNPSNPFYRPSAGAVPTIGASGAPTALTSPTSGSLPGVPPLQTGSLGAPPALNVPSNPLFGGNGPSVGATPQTAAGPSALATLLGQLKARQASGPSSLPGVPPLNFGGPQSTLPVNPQAGIPQFGS